MEFESQSKELVITKHEKHWVFTLNRPEKRNALSATLVEEMIAGIAEAECKQIPLIVFMGEGKNFCAGFDFTGYESASEGDLLLRFVRIETLLQKIAYSSCLTMAMAHGSNFGAGADIIASCKVRIATTDSKFRMPGLKFGLVLGTGRLARLIGNENARSLLQTTRMFNAQEAEDLGFITAQIDQHHWEGVIDQNIEIATSLPLSSRKQLYGITSGLDKANDDMAALVISASEPGIKDRIRKFRSG